VSIRTVAIGGMYHRVADPAWADPLDPSYSSVAPGRRWNPSGLSCLYLNADDVTARANVLRLFDGLPYGPEDLDPATAPVLIDVTVPDGVAADAFTSLGLLSLGLSSRFPLEASGDPVPHGRCQSVGQAAFDAGLDGIDCRSAAKGGVRELAWFPRDRTAEEVARRAFDRWW